MEGMIYDQKHGFFTNNDALGITSKYASSLRGAEVGTCCAGLHAAAGVRTVAVVP
jgi:hypothetical protein